jgi:2-keto-4-pentenoate hydratase
LIGHFFNQEPGSMNQFDDVIEAHATRLNNARKTGTTTELVTAISPSISAADARRIAELTLGKWGQPQCGFKLGYTSEAMRQQMRISQPNFGRLTADMNFSKGDSAPLVHPRVEPEIALRIAHDVCGHPQSDDDLLKLVDAVFPALEIVDTRYHDYVFRYEDNVADNSSAAGFVLGAAHARDVLLGGGFNVLLDAVDDQKIAGHSSAALGGPLQALRWFLKEAEALSETIPAGSIILTGGLTAAPPMKRGRKIVATFDALGVVSMTW